MPQVDRKEVLLRATYELLRKIHDSNLSDALAMTVFYGGAEGDGGCLMDEIAIELNIEDED